RHYKIRRVNLLFTFWISLIRRGYKRL
ncbi:hypothetical protein AZZ76_004744, partial [Klebsiella pneumoniae]